MCYGYVWHYIQDCDRDQGLLVPISSYCLKEVVEYARLIFIWSGATGQLEMEISTASTTSVLVFFSLVSSQVCYSHSSLDVRLNCCGQLHVLITDVKPKQLFKYFLYSVPSSYNAQLEYPQSVSLSSSLDSKFDVKK